MPSGERSSRLGTTSSTGAGPRTSALVGETEDQALFARVAPIVNGLVWSMLGPDSEREDIAHEAFIRHLPRPSLFAKRRQRRSVGRSCRGQYGQERAQTAPASPLGAVRLLERRSPLRTYVDDLQGRELLKAAFRVLDRLPTDERVALSLRLFHDVEVEEVARLTGCSLRTVKRRLSAARAQFERLAGRDPLLANWLGQQTKERDDG